MSDKPFVSKVLKFPTGEPIAPDGCYLVTNVLIGPYGKFKLPIKICVDKDISPESLTTEVINALACYYKWNKYPNVRPVSENGIATIVSRVHMLQDTSFLNLLSITMKSIPILWLVCLQH